MLSKKHVLNFSSEQLGAEGAAGGRDTIRVVIRDAKPPILARILQFGMRVICFLLLVCVCAIGIPRLLGVYEYNILTGSMTPTYPVGTLIFVQSKDPSSIRPGEVVTYVADENLTLVTHRCTSNNYDDKTITTRGDANNSDDAPVLYENVVGVVCFSLPYVGEIVDYLTNDELGRVVGIGILVAILALTFLAEGICSLLTKQNAKLAGGGKGKKMPGSKGDILNVDAASISNISGQMTFDQMAEGGSDSETLHPNWADAEKEAEGEQKGDDDVIEVSQEDQEAKEAALEALDEDDSSQGK